MTQYFATIDQPVSDRQPHSDVREVSWGYDRMLKEYFICGFDAEGDCLFSIRSWNTMVPLPGGKMRYSNSEIFEVYRIYQAHIPAAHGAALLDDLPF